MRSKCHEDVDIVSLLDQWDTERTEAIHLLSQWDTSCVKPSLQKKRGSFIPLASGVASIAIGVGVLVTPMLNTYADAADQVPPELPEVVGNLVPSQPDTPDLNQHDQDSDKRDSGRDQTSPPALPEIPSNPISQPDFGNIKPSPDENPSQVSEQPKQPSMNANPIKHKEKPQTHQSSVTTPKRSHTQLSHQIQSIHHVSSSAPVAVSEPAEVPDQSANSVPSNQKMQSVTLAQSSTGAEKKSVIPAASNTSTNSGEAPVVRTQNGTLPKTATNNPNGVVAGALFLLGGALIQRYYRVRNES